MQKVESAVIGGILGTLHGVVLWASMDSLALASWILYGNQYVLPLATTGIVSILSLLVVFSYQMWANVVFDSMVTVVEASQQEDELEGDDIE